ncbi:MAG: transposase family protein [Candidatus Nitrosopolaris sp.]
MVPLLEDDRWSGKWLIVYLRDASRFIVGYGIFDEATRENAISVLDDCINGYRKPLELLTDHGSQFYANFSGMKADGMSKFQQYLIDRKINPYTWKSTSSSN